VSGWSAQDAREFREGVGELRQRHGLPALASELAEDSIIRRLSGEYREGWRLALEVRAKVLQLGANPNLNIEYERAGSIALFNLLFLGEWGEALKELAAAIAQAQKNANRHYTVALRVHEAWLHLHAMDFKGVLAVCDSILPQPRDPARRTALGLPLVLPGPLRSALICSGSASVALGDYARAHQDLSTAASDMDRQTVLLDWYWRMPLAAGLTELWLAKGDRVRARLEAERFLDLSLATAGRTWHGLAWETSARVALADQDLARARDCIAKAVSTIEGFEVPLATWRVHATAAHIEAQSGHSESVRAHQEISRATILRLANSLPEDEPLRGIFLSAAPVARVLHRDS